MTRIDMIRKSSRQLPYVTLDHKAQTPRVI